MVHKRKFRKYINSRSQLTKITDIGFILVVVIELLVGGLSSGTSAYKGCICGSGYDFIWFFQSYKTVEL